MTKAKNTLTRKWLLAASLLLAAGSAPGAAQAATYVGVSLPVMTSYGSETPLYDTYDGREIIAPLTVTNVNTLAECNATLTAYATAAETLAKSVDGTAISYGTLGGCLGIGPAAGSYAVAFVLIEAYTETYGGFSFVLPVASTTTCAANQATIEGWFASLVAEPVTVTCL